jgi:ribosomal protein S18 acetylase RimI-like enzyme
VLDYTLVTPKAAYRPLLPADLPFFMRLVTSYYREDLPERSITPDRILATVKELVRHKDRGSVLLFEKGETLIGYCILINYWSNEHGGNLLVIDELYVVPEERSRGIETDFLDLLQKVAPRDCVAVQLEVERGNKKLMRLYEQLGFQKSDRVIMTGGRK